MRPSTTIMAMRAQAIFEHNKSLPPNKKKLFMPMIKASNVGTILCPQIDRKKGNQDLIYQFKQIGIEGDKLTRQSNLISIDKTIRSVS